MSVYFPHQRRDFILRWKGPPRCVDDLRCDVTEEEGHVTRDRGTRGASQEVFPGPISAELAELTEKESGHFPNW